MGKAATQLSMSQPAISKTIAEMEQLLGVHLLDRGPQGVTPTVFAKALLERGAIAFDELRLAIRDIEYLADPSAGDLRIGCSAVLAEGFVATVINHLSQLHPRITFHLSAEESGAIYRAVEQHEWIWLSLACSIRLSISILRRKSSTMNGTSSQRALAIPGPDDVAFSLTTYWRSLGFCRHPTV
jgi:hypothetical protein